MSDKSFWARVRENKKIVSTWPKWKQDITITAESASTGYFIKTGDPMNTKPEELKPTRKKRNTLEKDRRYRARIKKDEPWRQVLWNIHKRIYNDDGYKHLDCSLTYDEVKTLWIRDAANHLRRPSIDRKDNKSGYHFKNCEFIELGVNSVKDKRRKT